MFSFTLADEIVAPYVQREVPWGYTDAGGNALGEITFLRTYSRLKVDGTKERWHEVVRRVIEGMYSLLKDHHTSQRLPWDEEAMAAEAAEAYERLFELRWTPPGRGLWMMGTPLVNELRNSAALQNCAFVSTADMTAQDPAAPFTWLMEASMLGVGVGFDTRGAELGFVVQTPGSGEDHYVIPDTREGWVESVRRLLESYLVPGRDAVTFDYSFIRSAGEPIRTFGGTAAGPAPLRRLHTSIRRVLDRRAGEPFGTTEIADVGNLIGVCVVAGNVRRSAEILLGSIDDEAFLDLKNPEAFPERNSYSADAPGWAWMSNNSVLVETGTDLSPIVEGIARNGEPGVIWLDTTRRYGRLADPADDRDWRAQGVNPCGEQPLESFEMCTLVETYPSRATSKEDYLRTLYFAFLYAKTVTLLPTHWERTNAVMQRNRRIGTSASGLTDFADAHGVEVLTEWLDEGYAQLRSYDRELSERLAVRESIRVSTVKPSGTVSILAGVSPGVHWTPGGEYFNRAIRFGKDDPMVVLFRSAKYRVEPASEDPEGTVVVFFPVRSTAHRSEKQVSLTEKADMALLAQRYWSDNAVSNTLTFDPETEADQIGPTLERMAGKIKSVSFLPQGNFTFPQMPYTQITAEEYEAAGAKLEPVFLDAIYDGDMEMVDAIGEAYCETDDCELEGLELAHDDALHGVAPRDR